MSSLSLGDIIRKGQTPSGGIQLNFNKTKPPVPFTNDPFEFIEGKQYLGEKLFPKQKEIIDRFFSRNEKGTRNFNELILLIGMRGGKSILAAFIGSFCANQLMSYGKEYKEHFRISKNSTVSIPIIANSEDQAEKTIFGYIKTIHLGNEFWKKINEWLRDMEPVGLHGSLFKEETGKLRYGYYDLNIGAVPATSDTLAGLTSYCTLFDEISRLKVSNSGDIHGKTEKKSAQAIYYTLARQTKTFKNEGNSIVVSSPMYEDDFGMQLLLKSGELVVGEAGKYSIPLLADKIPHNQKKKTRIGYHYATWEYNEELNESDFTEEKRESMSAFKRDYMALPPASIEPFFEDRTALVQCIHPTRPHIVECDTFVKEKHLRDSYTGEIIETRNYVAKKLVSCSNDKITKRFICCDQGYKFDNFVLGIAHPLLTEVTVGDHTQKFYKTIIDGIIIWEPMNNGDIKVDFGNVEEVILELTHYLYIDVVTYDRWQSIKPIQSLFEKNVNSKILSITNSMYESFKKRLYQGLVDSVDVRLEQRNIQNALMDELVKLQKLRGTKIDHTQSSSKDISDVVCRLDAMVQNYEYEHIGTGQSKMIGAAMKIDPTQDTPNKVLQSLAEAQDDENSLWGLKNGMKDVQVGRSGKSIWGRSGIKRTKNVSDRIQHPASDFFRSIRTSKEK